MLAAGSTGPIDTNAPVDDIKAEMDRSIAQATGNATVAGNLNTKDANIDPVTGLTTATVTFTSYDSLGASQDVKATFTHDPASTTNAWNWSIVSPTSFAPAPSTSVTSGVLTFDADGQITNNPASATFTPLGTNGASNSPLTLDFNNITALNTGTNSSDVAMTYQDGVMAGRVTDLSIEPNSGRVILQFSNGLSQPLGQLALARFNNPTGLLRKGNTSFAESLSSGSPNVGAATTGGRGSITAGYLEGSNVDMANEFTNMILAQRGFQAQTRVITTSDEMLQELVNLKR